MRRYDAIVCNSQFTKREIDQQVGEPAVVIYPPVQSVPRDSGQKKKKRILSVGRFTGYFQAKKQDVLIEAFAQGYERGVFRDWELVLAGGLLSSDQDFFRNLKVSAANYPIRLLPNIGNDELVALYQSSTLYWHSAGFRETDPAQMEHFGITTAEAMSAGAVPLVYAAGGQLEIVTDGVNGLVWNTTGELVEKTEMLIKDKTMLSACSRHAVERSKDFGEAQFTRAFDALIAGWQ